MTNKTTNSGNKMVSHTSIYFFGDVLRYSVSLFMLPIYTSFLTPADYGAIELLSMLIDIANIIFGARVGESVFRYYCTEKRSNERKTIITSAIFMGLLFSSIGALVVIFISSRLSILLFSDTSYQGFIVLLAMTMLMVPLSDIPLAHIRAEQRPWLFFSFSLLRLIIQLSLNIYFVVFLEMHIEGVVYSAVISGTIMAAVLSGYSLYRSGLRAKLAVCKQLFSFSLPLKLSAIGAFYLTFGDRYVLNMHTDLSQVGIYALGYKFGFIFTLIAWTPFQKMWDAEKYVIHGKPNAIKIYQKVFVYTSSVLILFGLCISLFTKDLLKIMSDPAFWDAYMIVPIIITAYIIQAWTKYCDLGIYLEKKTMQIAYAEIIAVVVITAAYFTLIPKYGIHGAAWATIIGFSARFYWTNLISTRLYDMHLPWGKVAVACMLALSIFGLSQLAPEEIIASIVVRTFLLLGFMVTYFILPILSRDQKEEILNLVLRRQRRITIT